MSAVPRCRIATVHTFQGNRTAAFRRRIFRALDDERSGRAAGPSRLDCLLLAGHTGISTDNDQVIYGFNPDTGTLPVWQAMQQLKNGDAFPGVVLDDTHVFSTASMQGLKVLTFEVVLPKPGFLVFKRLLAEEKRQSQYSYGFPDGDGDCNCTTCWNGWRYRCSPGAWMSSLPCLDFAITLGAGSADADSEENTMQHSNHNKISPETMLGILAMRFRSTRDEAERDAIAHEYASVVTRLIKSGKWKTMPSFENQLPDEKLPREFFEYWDIPCPHEQNGRGGERK